MGNSKHGNPTGHESADACCSKHITALSERLAFWAEIIAQAKNKEEGRDREKDIEACVFVAVEEVSEILRTSCERVACSESPYGKAAREAITAPDAEGEGEAAVN